MRRCTFTPSVLTLEPRLCLSGLIDPDPIDPANPPYNPPPIVHPIPPLPILNPSPPADGPPVDPGLV